MGRGVGLGKHHEKEMIFRNYSTWNLPAKHAKYAKTL